MSGPPPASPFAGVRMVFVGNLNAYSRSRARLNAFRELGLEVTEVANVPVGDPRTGIERPGLARRIAGRLGIVLDWQRAGANVLRAIACERPQIVWIEKGAMLAPNVLDRFRTASPRPVLAWFSEDDMFARHNQTRRFRAGLDRYDVVFTTKSYNCAPEELPALGARRVVFVHQAFDPAQHHPVELTADDRAAFGADIGFIGSYEHARARSMHALAEAGMRVRIWGNLWDRSPFSHPNLQVERRPLVNLPPHDLAYSRGIAATRINLCFLRKMNRDQHTSRTFEIPAVGGFMLGERTAEHLALFKEGVEAEFFGSDEELVEKARHYLAHEAERRRIAARGHARCVANYGSTAQAERMLSAAFA